MIMSRYHYFAKHRREAKAFIRPERIALAAGRTALAACVLCAAAAIPLAKPAPAAVPQPYPAISVITGAALPAGGGEHDPLHVEPPEQTPDGSAAIYAVTAPTAHTVPQLATAWPPPAGPYGARTSSWLWPEPDPLRQHPPTGPYAMPTTRLASLPAGIQVGAAN